MDKWGADVGFDGLYGETWYAMDFANDVDIAVRDEPEKLATSDPRRGLTYGELAAGTDAVANGSKTKRRPTTSPRET